MSNYDFVAIDFETANEDNSSACSIGLVAVKDNKIAETYYSYIKPLGMYFNKTNIEIHGITPDHVSDAPTFPEVWSQINDYFKDDIVIAHNAAFDMSVLKMSLLSYQVPLPNFKYLCSLPITSIACPGYVGKSLKDRVSYFGLEMTQHHNAISDAEACAAIVLKSIDATKQRSFENFYKKYRSLSFKNFLDLKPQKSFGKNSRFETIKMSEISSTNGDCDINHPLYGKSIVFTGEYVKLTRRTAMQKAADVGALVRSSVSKKTNYLVVGAQDNSIVGNDGMSNKEERAYALIDEGYEIKIISEGEYLGML